MISMLPSTTLQFQNPAGNLKFKTVNITLEHQARTQWCWASVAMGVSGFFNVGSQWTQCTIATQVIGIACCGPQRDDDGCNVPQPLEDALLSVGVTARRFDVFDIGAIAAEISNAHRPVAIRIEWTDSQHAGEGHYSVVSGVESTKDPAAVRYVKVMDPLYGPGICSVDELQGAYTKNRGRWTNSYFMQF